MEAGGIEREGESEEWKGWRGRVRVECEYAMVQVKRKVGNVKRVVGGVDSQRLTYKHKSSQKYLFWYF